MDKFKVLLVEDNQPYALRLKKELFPEFECFICQGYNEVISFLENGSVDLAVVDIGLGDVSGFEIARILGEKSRIPIAYLTSKNDVANRMTAYSLGAQDFIEKSVDYIELKIRLKNVLCRSQLAHAFLEKGGIRLDVVKRDVYVRSNHDWIKIDFSTIEFNLLWFFMKNIGHALSREQILDSVWRQKMNVSDRTVDAHIFAIRKKLGRYACQIQSVFGHGYRFQVVDDSRPDVNLIS